MGHALPHFGQGYAEVSQVGRRSHPSLGASHSPQILRGEHYELMRLAGLATNAYAVSITGNGADSANPSIGDADAIADSRGRGCGVAFYHRPISQMLRRS
jgi:hypothetical protein